MLILFFLSALSSAVEKVPTLLSFPGTDLPSPACQQFLEILSQRSFEGGRLSVAKMGRINAAFRDGFATTQDANVASSILTRTVRRLRQDADPRFNLARATAGYLHRSLREPNDLICLANQECRFHADRVGASFFGMPRRALYYAVDKSAPDGWYSIDSWANLRAPKDLLESLGPHLPRVITLRPKNLGKEATWVSHLYHEAFHGAYDEAIDDFIHAAEVLQKRGTPADLADRYVRYRGDIPHFQFLNVLTTGEALAWLTEWQVGVAYNVYATEQAAQKEYLELQHLAHSEIVDNLNEVGVGFLSEHFPEAALFKNALVFWDYLQWVIQKATLRSSSAKGSN